jgi:hypothetical protein
MKTDENILTHGWSCRGGFRSERSVLAHDHPLRPRSVFHADLGASRPQYGIGLPGSRIGTGIGPIDSQAIPITGMDFDAGEMHLTSPDGRIVLKCESSGIAVTVCGDSYFAILCLVFSTRCAPPELAHQDVIHLATPGNPRSSPLSAPPLFSSHWQHLRFIRILRTWVSGLGTPRTSNEVNDRRGAFDQRCRSANWKA